MGFVVEAQGWGKDSPPSRKPKTQEADRTQGPVKAIFTLLPLDCRSFRLEDLKSLSLPLRLQVLKPYSATKSPGVPLKMQIPGPDPRGADPLGLR